MDRPTDREMIKRYKEIITDLSIALAQAEKIHAAERAAYRTTIQYLKQKLYGTDELFFREGSPMTEAERLKIILEYLEQYNAPAQRQLNAQLQKDMDELKARVSLLAAENDKLRSEVERVKHENEMVVKRN